MDTIRPTAFFRWLQTLLAACLLVMSVTARAAPVHLSYSGVATSYLFQESLLTPFIAPGTPMNLSLTYNETYSDGTYDFSDNLGPVSGTMSVGALNYVLNGYHASSYAFNLATNEVDWVGTQFTGSGPAPTGAELFGLFLYVTPALTLQSDPLLGFGWSGPFGTNYGYVAFTGEAHFTPINPVPEPVTLVLLGTGLVGFGVMRHRRR